ncbi:hypothetical protein F2Q70_00002439 [Brassica cretica]|uniref:Uncharacterized protein n=1 Tax=Brassica cretica TaxID=69181 RepID=A0A8S9J4U4_BRACR|nr:hypothetical protein F2Q70_00002439 [Brassica cretica]
MAQNGSGGGVSSTSPSEQSVWCYSFVVVSFVYSTLLFLLPPIRLLGLWRPSPALSFSVYPGLPLVSVLLVASSGGSDEVYALHEEVIRVACSLVSFVARKLASLSALSGSDEVYALHEEVIRVACSLVSRVGVQFSFGCCISTLYRSHVIDEIQMAKKKKYSRRWCLSSYFSCPFNNSCYHRRHGGNNFGGEADDKCLNQLVETMISGVKKEELMPNHKRNGYGLYAHQTGLNQ